MYFCAVNVLLPKKRTILPNPLFVLKLSIFNVKKSLSVSYSNLVLISSGIAGNTAYNFPLMKYARPLRKAMANIIGMGIPPIVACVIMPLKSGSPLIVFSESACMFYLL
ncbi:hypothetical protein D11S_2317 (plasmid) [Aggregatibacter actinomycetemcomitans D11S-1]|nr:hypothetical protein D11S_2317 [Aggregatibacter actinomycetemcomitans D11S-1]